MFWTSRKGSDIQFCFQKQDSSAKLEIDLSSYKRAIDHDIGCYIDATLELVPYESWAPQIREEAREALIKKANGM